jgi:hypothetical protein
LGLKIGLEGWRFGGLEGIRRWVGGVEVRRVGGELIAIGEKHLII